MQLLINLGEGNSGRWTRKSRVLALAIKPVLEALVRVDQLYLLTHQVPPIYESGVRYHDEPKDQIEEFAAIPLILQRGWGDCDDLAPWRVAELQNAGVKAKLRIQWKRYESGKLYHIVVRMPDRSIEDPSRLLGMGRLRKRSQ